MRKDYLPVESGSCEIDEAAFVEQYWTGQWKDRAQPPGDTSVRLSEEYRIMRPYMERLAPESHILDGGCGMGQWTAFFANRGFRVVGVDISEETVARLKVWFPQLEFIRADLRSTNFESESFDAYFSWGTFEHFESGLGGCLSEARRILKPGGLLFVSVPFHNWRLILRDRRRLETWDEHFDSQRGYTVPQRFYQWRLTRPELQRELELHGFKVRTIKSIGKLTGTGRMLQWDLPLFDKDSRAYCIARRALSVALPSFFISHMILAVAERRP